MKKPKPHKIIHLALVAMTLITLPGTGNADTYVVGDSHTTGNQPYLADGLAANASWAGFIEANIDGWAKKGATSEDMLAQVTPSDALTTVVMAGTNDLHKGWARSRTRDALIAIHDTTATTGFLLMAIPPRTGAEAETTSYNNSLHNLATAQGWGWFDPWAPVRAADGGWLYPRYTVDGIHATRGVYESAGHRISDALHTYNEGLPQ